MAGLQCVSRRRRVTTTRRDPQHQPANDPVGRNFTADRPDQLWVADITDVPTAAGFLYLAMLLDGWSRRVMGWVMGNTLHARLVMDAFNMAVAARKPEGVIHHSDQGCQLGLNRSSQHRGNRGRCDGGSAAFGSGFA